MEGFLTGLTNALKLLSAALVVVLGWVSGRWTVSKLSSRGWVIVLGGLVFIVLFHVAVWLISGQSQDPVAGIPGSSDSRCTFPRGLEEFGYDMFGSVMLACITYWAFASGAHSATVRLARRSIYTELSVWERVSFCTKACAVVAVIAIVFGILLGMGSYDADQGVYTDFGYKVTPAERFVYSVSWFFFLVTPALLGVWWILRQPLLDAWRGTAMTLYRRVYNGLWILPDLRREEFMADPALAERVYRAEADQTLDSAFFDRLNDDAKTWFMNKQDKRP